MITDQFPSAPPSVGRSYLVYSDTHLAHNKTPIDTTISSLESLWTKPWFRDLDVLFIAGDLYDRKLDYNSYEASAALLHMMRLGKICQNYNISLYILEGTPSHDWKQASKIPDVYKQMGLEFDYAYIDTICIRHIKALDRNVLFVPDEMGTPEEVYREVNRLSKETPIDMAIMHGSFKHQHPKFLEHLCHDEHDYLDLVKYLIHAGHIHQHSVYDRIVIQGSWDRYTHGDEEDKGCLLVKNDTDWEFIKNTEAVIYKTIKIMSGDEDRIIERVGKLIRDIPIGSHIRILTRKGSPVPMIIKDIRLKYPGYRFTLQYQGSENEITSTKKLLRSRESMGIQITERNILPMLITKIEAIKPDLTEEDKKDIEALVASLIEF